MESRKCGPVWPSGVGQIGWLAWRGVKVRFHFCSPFSLEVEDEVRGCFLFCDFVPSQTLGHYDSAHRLPILMQNHSGGDSIALYTFSLLQPPSSHSRILILVSTLRLYGDISAFQQLLNK